MGRLIIVARIVILLSIVGYASLPYSHAAIPTTPEVETAIQTPTTQDEAATNTDEQLLTNYPQLKEADQSSRTHEPTTEKVSVDHRWKNLYEDLLSKEVWSLILGGLYTTVVIFIFAAILAILLGAALAYCAINHKWPWIYKPVNWFILTIHDVPSVVLMMFFYYVIFAGEMNGVLVSIIALGIYTSGSLSKIFKIHILQVGKGQMEAGKMLGLTTKQCYRYIILPQAVKTILPLITAELKVQLRATSYAGYIAQKDLVKMADAIRIHTDDTLIPLVIISILYLILSWIIAQIIHLLYKKFFDHD